MAIDVILVDDHQILRQGLKSLVESSPRLKVVGEAADGRTALELVEELHPQVVIMDVALPRLNGVETAQRIRENHPNVKILGLSMHTEPELVRRMLRAGANGYVLKDTAFDELLEAIESVLKGKRYLCPGIADIIIEDYVHQLRNAPQEEVPQLTPREQQVLELLASGKSSREIADALDVSVKTVGSHRRNIMQKLDLHSVAELTKFALRRGLTKLSD